MRLIHDRLAATNEMGAGIMSTRVPYLTCAFLISFSLFLSSGLLAQDKEKPKLKDFGSSLKRKSDPGKKPAEVNSKSGSKPDDNDIEIVKVETSLVSNDVLVLDAKGDFVAGLTDKDFVVTEDGQPQQVGMFLMGDNVKVSRSIVLIIDYSGSQAPFIKTSVAAAKALVDKLPSSDSMAIVTDDVELIQDFTKDKHKLKSKLDSLLNRVSPDRVSPDRVSPSIGSHFGKSKQYSALLATLNEAFNNEDQRPIVIFQTDGDQLGHLRDTPLTTDPPPAGILDKRQLQEFAKQQEAQRVAFSLDDICRAAEKARATIYTVIPGHQLLGRPVDEQVAIVRKEIEDFVARSPFPVNGSGLLKIMMTKERLESSARNQLQMQSALASVATSTGGWTMFLETPDDADHIYSSIFSDINRRYIVGYYPTNKDHDGKRRKLEMVVRNHPDYMVIGRRWYYAPAPDQ
jgi:VWFA-related protein